MTEPTTTPEPQAGEGRPNGDGEQVSEPTAASPDRGDFEGRLRSDPEFAISEFKKTQAHAGRLQTQLDRSQLARQIAEQVGSGDPERGAQVVLEALQKYQQLTSHPSMSRMIAEFEKTGRVSSALDDDLDDPDSQEKVLSDLRGTDQKLAGEVYKLKLSRQLDGFLQSDLGKSLTSEQREGFLDAMDKQIQQWSTNPSGQQQLETMTEETFRIVALGWLDKRGLLSQVYGRIARSEEQRRSGAATESPSGISSTLVENIPEWKSTPGTPEHAREVLSFFRKNRA